jgi:GNAT superfamily N-acetyltransferase
LEDTQLNIRLATDADIPKVAFLWKRMNKEFEPDNISRLDWWVTQTRELLKTRTYYLFVAEEGEDFLGYVNFIVIDEPSDGKRHAIGQQLYVIPEYRNTPLAGRLWKAAYTAAKKAEAQMMDTTAYNGTRPFWEKRGFTLYCYYLRKEV